MNRNNINIMNDALFKALFRSKEARGMISSFLSSVTGIDKDILLNAQYIGGEIPKHNINEKGKISDVIVRIDNNNRIIVEMNQYSQEYLFEKNSSYAFSLITNIKKIKRNEYPNIILINIDNFNKFKTDKAILNFKLRDEEGHIENNLYNSIHIIIENAIKSDYNEDENVKKFCTFLKSSDVDKLKDYFKGDEEYMAGIVKIEDMMKDVDEVGLLYDKEEEYKRLLEEEKYFARIKGKDEGKKEGLIESAKKMINSGMKIDEVTKILGISKEEL